MKSTLTRITLISFLLVLFIPNLTFAEIKTFIKEYAYQASEYDSKVTSRTLALEQVKRILLEELGTYLESQTEVANLQLTKDQITMVTAGIVRTEVVEEKWDGKTYWIKVEMAADTNQVAKSIDNLIIQRQLLNKLIAEKQKVDKALKEIEQLKGQKKFAKTINKKSKDQKLYDKKIRAIKVSEIWHNELDIRNKGALAFDDGYYDVAIESSRKILANPQSEFLPHAYWLLGVSYREKGMYDEAIRALNKSIELTPSSYLYSLSAIHSALGKTYAVMRLYDKAIVEHRKALVLLYDEKKRLSNQLPSKYNEYPETTKRRKELTDIKIANHHLSIFSAYTQRAFSLSPSNDPDEKIYLPEEAMPEVWKVFEMKPNSSKILNQIHVLIAGRKCEEFITWCDKLIKFRQDDSEVYFIRGMNHLCLKDYRQSIGDISKAIKLNPNVAAYYEKRAFIYCSIGINNEGTQDFNKAIELNPASADLYFGRGICGTSRQEWQRIDDLKIAARLSHGEAQELLRKRGIDW